MYQENPEYNQEEWVETAEIEFEVDEELLDWGVEVETQIAMVNDPELDKFIREQVEKDQKEARLSKLLWWWRIPMIGLLVTTLGYAWVVLDGGFFAYVIALILTVIGIVMGFYNPWRNRAAAEWLGGEGGDGMADEHDSEEELEEVIIGTAGGADVVKLIERDSEDVEPMQSNSPVPPVANSPRRPPQN